MQPDNWIPADWPAPAHVRAGTTTRLNGSSPHPFDGFNLAGHVNDRPDAVAANRRQLRAGLNLPSEPVWLQQQHGNRVLRLNREPPAPADGAHTDQAETVCAVLSADCVPVLLCERDGSEVAALHAGWRGLCRRIIKHGLSLFAAPPRELLAWVGPHIRQEHYEVGAEVVSACSSIWEETAAAITPARSDRWYLSLVKLVTTELRQLGVAEIYDCNYCTYNDRELFYSYRRDGATGRTASLIWKVSLAGTPYYPNLESWPDAHI